MHFLKLLQRYSTYIAMYIATYKVSHKRQLDVQLQCDSGLILAI